MAKSNSEIVRAAFEAFNEGGPEAFIPFTHPDVEFSTPSDLASEPDTYRGHDGVRRYWDSFFEIMDEIKVEPRELYDRGASMDEAISHGIKRTAGVVTSAAVVMVGVFSIFAALSMLMFKQFGVGLATAILIDATIVRAVLLPASMKLLGDWNWYLPTWLQWLPRRSAAAPTAPVSA